ncbi:hypothetical protein CLIB1444_01S16600 [[Candida] jaroonii]|uniref:Uncharacterized protein n=1 Tax=[Candida] jaroonii TaxID=467808 RepID=A0ACA9Y1P0_9ASCO|nr:hypothetical protein CLIB1444_01S16600 [[Candida] jaroonii]
MVLYGLNQLILKIGIKFPASVLGMLINIIWLCILSSLSKYKWAEKLLHGYLKLVQPSMNFSLKWINVFFLPSFIILPLSQHITFIEVLKIAAVFIIGWWALMVLDVYLILLLRILFNRKRKSHPKKEDTEEPESFNLFTSMRDITTIELRQVKTEPKLRVSLTIDENPFVAKPEQSYMKSPSAPASLFDHNGYDEDIDSGDSDSIAFQHQQPNKLPKEDEKVVIFITNYIDWILWSLLFVVSLPLYYIPSYHLLLPFHLSISVLSFYVALSIPLKWPATKRFAHPLLISTFLILLICWISSLIYSHQPKGFLDDLKYYKTGKNYLNLFNGKPMLNNGEVLKGEAITRYPFWPGCGDIFSSLMDVSIISLSLPMFTHRKDFVKNFWILIPILVSMVLTFFLYPIVCHAIGIQSQRSIGFIGRSVTLAMGMPLIEALNGSTSLMAVCTILSGICGVLIGDYVYLLLKIPKDDFVTRGVSLGINCGAIATAHLLTTDPRAASMSSLSFTIFATVMIIFASIGSIRDLVNTLVGL